jgi:calcineurin-like phosphoesterase family protein
MRLNIDLTQGKQIRNIFFTSDFHLFHKNVLKFDNRPFIDVYEMHQVIEERWNEIVGPDDIVIYLGDLSFARAEDKPSVEGMMYRLNGHIHFVLGNHDKIDEIKKIGKFESVQDYLEVRITHMGEDPYHIGLMKRTETLFTCMHYPIYSWNKSHHGSYMIHGHCHGNLHHGEDASFYVNRRVIDVGCMLHDYRPISYLEVMDKLKDVVLPELKRNNENK